MLEASQFIDAARARGFGLYAGVPCSYLKPFINFVIDAPDLDYIGVTNEGDAVAIAAGAELGGRHAVVMLQNSGLGNTVNPLTSLTHIFRIPLLIIVTLRGEPGGAPDEPQHELMGAITPRLLELMQIEWDWFPPDAAGVAPVLDRAVAYMDRECRPFALIMKKGSVAPHALSSPPRAHRVAAHAGPAATASATRTAMLAAVRAATGDADIVIATTGYTGRELYALGDAPNQLYMVGSMGCASSLGLGLAVARPDRRVIVIDGDGAGLMRLGAMATLGYERPANLVHVLLDNGMHESTGGQTTVSRSIDFAGIASACGYPRVATAATPAALETALHTAHGVLTFCHAPTLPGVPEGLPRPTIQPHEVAARLRDFLAADAA